MLKVLHKSLTRKNNERENCKFLSVKRLPWFSLLTISDSLASFKLSLTRLG